MINIEKIQFGEQTFDLVANGVQLTKEGGTITFQKGDTAFENIDLNLQKNGEIIKLGTSGDPDWSRTDLVFAGRLTKQSNYDIGAGVKAVVMIAEFHTPDTREQIKDLTADVAYLSMMSEIDMEVMAL